MEASLTPYHPLDPSTPGGPQSAYWVGPRHLAGDDGCLYDAVADTLADLGWTSLTIVRGRQKPDEAPEDRQVLRSTVLHISPGTPVWTQWSLADEPFHLGELPVAWQVSAREDRDSSLAAWNAYFTPGVPGEVLVNFLLALDACEEPTAAFAGSEAVLDALTAHGWLRDIDQPEVAAMDPTFTSHISLCEVPPLIQDTDTRTLTQEVGETGPVGWQAWAEPVMGAPYLWCASFSASVPHDLVAAFAASLASPVPVLRRVLPESTQDRLLRTPAS